MRLKNTARLQKTSIRKLMRNGKKTVKNHEVTIHNEQTTNVISMVPDGGNIKSLPPEYWEH